MNYLHAYHAGNFADVVKHLTMTLIIEYLKHKDTPFRLLDTHAGSGIYQLTEKEAQATGEADTGILRLFENMDPKCKILINSQIDEVLAPYLDVVSAMNTGEQLQTYPGSPLLAKQLLRSADRITACELRISEYEKLNRLFGRDKQILTRNIDSWKEIKGLLPLEPKRGLILMDPPFEQPNEFERALDAICLGTKRFSGGIYALWYPIKARHQADKWSKLLVKRKPEMGVETILRSELYVRAPDNDTQLNGTGMIIVNPPYTLFNTLDTVLPVLQRILQQASKTERFQKTVLETL
ncbi:MAG: 23S rRNA (adenine(2030)-N(6))-methyltransferase RlmJ [Hyphomicrobiales bacterium]|uniref:23S rRNA (adenine(2030)-N(6))-methyltransferase RlmJ n=1 Tax=Nisaea sp. TaxID=2024842 RepID=UPI0032822A9E